jgi:hypothetical protein
MRQESHPQKRERLHMLERPGHHSDGGDSVLGGSNHETIGHWLDAYVAGGLDGLLTLYVPAGKPSAPTPEAMADLAQALHNPKGFGTYQAICDRLFAEHGITVRKDAMGQLHFGGKPTALLGASAARSADAEAGPCRQCEDAGLSEGGTGDLRSRPGLARRASPGTARRTRSPVCDFYQPDPRSGIALCPGEGTSVSGPGQTAAEP